MFRGVTQRCVWPLLRSRKRELNLCRVVGGVSYSTYDSLTGGQGGTRLRNENSLVIRLTSRIHFLKGSPVPGNPRGRESTNRVSLGPRHGFQMRFTGPSAEDPVSGTRRKSRRTYVAVVQLALAIGLGLQLQGFRNLPRGRRLNEKLSEAIAAPRPLSAAKDPKITSA